MKYPNVLKVVPQADYSVIKTGGRFYCHAPVL